VSGYLLDTNALLFLVFRSDRLAPDRIAALARKPRFVSHVCAIEIAIKQALGKLTLPPPFQTDFTYAFSMAVESLGATTLAIDMPHIEVLSRLPLHHRDPFDRLVIAQALSVGLTVITRDRSFSLYAGLDVYEI